jgi:membrane protease YdiL (CAAX protease family)
VIVMTISVMGEEIGWRGFALPQMQKQWTALKTSLVLGTIHTLWHLPFWIVLGELERFGWGYWILSWAWILAITIYITWFMNNTGNSLLMVILFHWTLNVVSVGYLPITTLIPAYITFIVIAWVIALGLFSLFGSKRLVRQSKAAMAIS